MNSLHELSSFNVLYSFLTFFNISLKHIATIFLFSFVLFYVILKSITCFFAVRMIKSKIISLATKYFFITTFIISKFNATLILQIIILQIYANKAGVVSFFAVYSVLVFKSLIAVIILIDKQFLKLFCYVSSNYVLTLLLAWNILFIFVVTFFCLFILKTAFLYNFALQVLLFLVLISYFKKSSADPKIINSSLLFKIILKIIKNLYLLNLLFLIKTVRRTMKNLRQINNNKIINIITLLLSLNILRFFKISEKNWLETK